MDNAIDIIKIDSDIKTYFEDEIKNLNSYIEKLSELKQTQLSSYPLKTKFVIEQNIKNLEDKIENIKTGETYNFYIASTVTYIEMYKKILETPVKISFVSSKKSLNNEEKISIINNYLQIAKQYYHNIPLSIMSDKNEKPISCENCSNTKHFDIDENIYICKDCGFQKEIQLYSSSYKDSDRISLSSRYLYDRKVHFKDCINQYQGKQNSTIDAKVYSDLEIQFNNHNLLINSTLKKEKYAKITKEHIIFFLKELGYTKHYENVNLIFSNITGHKLDDISYLETKLLDDFDILTSTYDTMFKNKLKRTNFINTQYVLYQLLQRHKHPCRKEDFIMLKTIERQCFHDDITKQLFEHLGWNMKHTYG